MLSYYLTKKLMELIVEVCGSNTDWDTECPELSLFRTFLHVNSGTVPPNTLRSHSDSYSHLYGHICDQTG